MGKIGNMRNLIKSTLLLVLVAFITIVGSNFFVIMKINFTEIKVGKVCFSNHYFVKSTNKEMKIENFKEFMLINDWEFIENYYGTIIFRKGNLQKEIQVDTLIGI